MAQSLRRSQRADPRPHRSPLSSFWDLLLPVGPYGRSLQGRSTEHGLLVLPVAATWASGPGTPSQPTQEGAEHLRSRPWAGQARGQRTSPPALRPLWHRWLPLRLVTVKGLLQSISAFATKPPGGHPVPRDSASDKTPDRKQTLQFVSQALHPLNACVTVTTFANAAWDPRPARAQAWTSLLTGGPTSSPPHECRSQGTRRRVTTKPSSCRAGLQHRPEPGGPAAPGGSGQLSEEGELNCGTVTRRAPSELGLGFRLAQTPHCLLERPLSASSLTLWERQRDTRGRTGFRDGRSITQAPARGLRREGCPGSQQTVVGAPGLAP